MRVRSLTVRRMPGIEKPFTVEAPEGGLTVITGPNGSGKTTVCRAVRALLWPQPDGPSPFHVEAEIEIDGRSVAVEREGRGDTQWSERGETCARPPLPAPQLAACYTLGLFELVGGEGGTTDRAISTEILRQMTGGYDLDAVLADVGRVSTHAGRKEARELGEQASELARLKGEREDLASREDALEHKRELLRQARAAGRQLTLLRHRQALLEAEHACDEASAVLGSFPEALARMTGEERATLDELAAGIKRARHDLADCEGLIRDAEKTIDGAGIPEGAVAPTELATWKTRAAGLAARENELRQAEEREAAAEAELAEAGRQLDPAWDEERAPAFDSEAVDEAVAHLRRTAACELELQALDAILGHEELEPRTSPAETRPLERGIETLEDWLADGGAAAGGPVAVALAALGLVAGVAAAVVVALEVTPLGWILAGAIGLVAAWLLQRTLARSAARARLDQERRSRFLAARLPAPDAWNRSAVAERLSALREQLAAARLDALRSHFRTRFQSDRRDRERTREEVLPAERERLRERLGVAPGAAALEISEFARRVHEYRRAKQRLEGHRAARTHLAGKRDDELAALNEFTRSFGYEAAADAAESTEHLEDLDRRARDAVRAREIRSQEEQRRTSLESRLEELERKRQDLFTGLGLEPGDDGRLTEFLRLRPGLLQARDELQRVEANLEMRRGDLESNPDRADFPETEALDLTALAERLPAVEETSAGAENLAREIGAIESEVERARNSREIEEASARRQAALDALREVRDQAVLAEAGRLLVEEARDRHEQTSRPEVLERARGLFEKFTRGDYQLEVRREDTGRAAFRAVETRRDRSLGLEQLSDGTRAQLLLAARLAFAFENERGVKPPLFLDEALSTSDPDRFHAIARSLVELVRSEGRQVFYLTSNPADVAFWNRTLEAAGLPAARPFDLAVQRTVDAAAPPPQLDAISPRLPPPPEGLTAAEYGLRLGVPRFDPWEDTADVHLFYLLDDDLVLLHRMVSNRVETVAAWRTYRDRLRHDGVLDDAAARRLEARIDLTDAFLSAWRIGRGRPVTREVLEASGAVTEKFIDDVSELNRRLGGDGKALVSNLRDREVRGFHQSKAEQLAEYLERHGHLDLRDPVDPEHLRRMVAESLGPAGVAAMPLAELSRRVEALGRLAGVSLAAPA